MYTIHPSISQNTSEVAGTPPAVAPFFGANETSLPPNPKLTPTGLFNHFGAFVRAAAYAQITWSYSLKDCYCALLRQQAHKQVHSKDSEEGAGSSYKNKKHGDTMVQADPTCRIVICTEVSTENRVI
jgi:hypothetical protein